MDVCCRCKKNIDSPRDYGCYIADKQIELCTECADKWITMQKEHIAEEQAFLEEVK